MTRQAILAATALTIAALTCSASAKTAPVFRYGDPNASSWITRDVIGYRFLHADGREAIFEGGTRVFLFDFDRPLHNDEPKNVCVAVRRTDRVCYWVDASAVMSE